MTTQNLFLRDDTFLGVCEGVGQDLGIPANLLRIAFAVALLVNAKAAIATYLALGVVVLVSRLAFPARKQRKPATIATLPAPASHVDEDAYTLPLAA